MMKHVKQRKTWRIGILAVLSMALLTSFSCKNTNDPEMLATILAQNICGAAVDVFLNGVYQFSVEHATDETIPDVPFGTYTLEARKKGEDMLVFSGPLDITDNLKYIWVIEGPSYIVISNQYGESLDIYMNGSFVGPVPDKEGRVIPSIGFGTHEMVAARSVDGIVVEKLNLEVVEVAEYQWTIIKPITN